MHGAVVGQLVGLLGPGVQIPGHGAGVRHHEAQAAGQLGAVRGVARDPPRLLTDGQQRDFDVLRHRVHETLQPFAHGDGEREAGREVGGYLLGGEGTK